MRDDIEVIRRAINIHSEKAVWQLQCAMTPGADNDTSVRLLMTGAAAGDPCRGSIPMRRRPAFAWLIPVIRGVEDKYGS